ncbi:hypothetical protein NPIL_102151 [Nephila pilipes]|uniref:Uncharacterized protein n=1 Tax=Nephila pilipes TaxID=299642 RepID=A0A8X6Q3I2_NEPPI|nr:hypothetical protein NPIL_102151 [Nephila pilipes]
MESMTSYFILLESGQPLKNSDFSPELREEKKVIAVQFKTSGDKKRRTQHFLQESKGTYLEVLSFESGQPLKNSDFTLELHVEKPVTTQRKKIRKN